MVGVEGAATQDQEVLLKEADLAQRSLGPYLPTHTKDIDAIFECIEKQIVRDL